MRYGEWLERYCKSQEGLSWMQTEEVLKKMERALNEGVSTYVVSGDDLRVCVRALRDLREKQEEYRRREWHEDF